MTEPDPRIARTRAKVQAATLELLAEQGSRDLTIEKIAQRSGVAKSSIYRHWASLPPLVLDAFQTVNTSGPDRPRTGNLREDLEGFLGELAHTIDTAPWAPLMATLTDAAERDPQLRRLLGDLIERRRTPLRAILTDAVERGDLPRTTDPDLLAGVLGGTLFYRRLISHEPLDTDFVRDLLDQVLPTTADDRPA
jgi:AcrR family transcriptional regulator